MGIKIPLTKNLSTGLYEANLVTDSSCTLYQHNFYNSEKFSRTQKPTILNGKPYSRSYRTVQSMQTMDRTLPMGVNH